MKEERESCAVRAPDLVGQLIDTASCEVLDGHQHEVVDVGELSKSIAALGQLHHALVIEYTDGRRFIAAGRRRWLACKELKIDLKADIWRCEPDDIDLELFARAVRIAENLQRSEPSSMDIAIQLRATRNQCGFKNARELAEHMKMSESSVKSYLSVFRASDHLQEMAQRYAIPLAQVLELSKCEKALGAARTRKLIEGVCKGELVQKDLAKLRNKPKRKPKTVEAEPAPKRRKGNRKRLQESGDVLLKVIAEAPTESVSYVRELMGRLSQFLPKTETQP